MWPTVMAIGATSWPNEQRERCGSPPHPPLVRTRIVGHGNMPPGGERPANHRVAGTGRGGRRHGREVAGWSVPIKGLGCQALFLHLTISEMGKR